VSLQVEETPSKLYWMPARLKLCSVVTIISHYDKIISFNTNIIIIITKPADAIRPGIH
jgi:hypothetical protein